MLGYAAKLKTMCLICINVNGVNASITVSLVLISKLDFTNESHASLDAALPKTSLS